MSNRMKVNIRKHEDIHSSLLKGLKELDAARYRAQAEAIRSAADTAHIERLQAKLEAASLILDEATKEFYAHFRSE